MRQVFGGRATLLERQSMVREIDHREALAAVLQLLMQRREEIIRLRDAVEVAGDLLVLHKRRIAVVGALARLGVGAHQMEHYQLGRLRLIGQRLLGKLQQILILGILRDEITGFQEMHAVGTFGNAGNRRVIVAQLPLIGEPVGPKAGALGQRDDVVLKLRLLIFTHQCQRQAEGLLGRRRRREVIVKADAVGMAHERRVIPMSAKGAVGISARAFTNHHHIDLLRRLHGQHMPVILHGCQRLHALMFATHRHIN